MATKVSTNQNAENQLPRRSASQSESRNNASSDSSNQNSLKTSFLRRFNRLSAKTRTKYRNELRRSNSLLDLRTSANQRSRSESTERTTSIQNASMKMDQSENGSIQDWIGRRLRSRGSTNQRALSQSETKTDQRSSEVKNQTTTLPNLNSGCTYVGNTLLKQKPRLRVRNTQQPINAQNAFQANNDADNTSQDTLSIEDRILDYDPRRGRSSSCSRGPAGSGFQAGTPYIGVNGNSGSELSDMEQVLFRAARLRSRRVRSASNETRGTDRTSQLDNYSFQTEKSGSAAGFDDSDSHPGDDDSFLIYGSCAKTYNQRIRDVAANQNLENRFPENHDASKNGTKAPNSENANFGELNPELISLSTEYEPNFSTSSESGAPPSGSSSGYGGSAGSSSGYNSSDQNQPIREAKSSNGKSLANELLADKVIENIPTNQITVNRVESFEPNLKSRATEFEPDTKHSTNQTSARGQKIKGEQKEGHQIHENSGTDQTTEQNDKSDKPSLFYVALVGNDKKVKNANYRVRSGYTGPTLRSPGHPGCAFGGTVDYDNNEIRKSNSMSEVRDPKMSGGCIEGAANDWTGLDRSGLGSGSSHRTRLQRGTPMRGSLPANFNRSGHPVVDQSGQSMTSNDLKPSTDLQSPANHASLNQISRSTTGPRRGSSGSNASFTIKPDNIKVTESNKKDEWKITIKISREKDESDDYRTTSEAESVPGRHTIIREARIKKKFQKENQTQTSPQATRATSPKSPDTDSEPCMVPHIRQMPPKSGSLPQCISPMKAIPTVIQSDPSSNQNPMSHCPISPMPHRPEQQNLSSGEREGRTGLKMLRTEFAKSGPGGRKDVLPDMPRRCYLTRTQITPMGQVTQGGKQNKTEFKSILNKWEDRCHLLRAS
jgi:hypothetical protein